MIGDFLYGLQGQEAVSQPAIQRATFRVSGTAAAATSITLNPAFTVPNDKIGIVTNLSLHGLAGAAQTVVSLLAFSNAPDGAILQDIEEFVPPTAAQFNGRGIQCWILLLPSERLSMTAFFSAGGVNNNVRMAGHVLLLPKGNIQLR